MKNNCAFTKPGQIFVLAALADFAGCAAPPALKQVEVRSSQRRRFQCAILILSGVVIPYSIAREHNMDFREPGLR